jgi:hypothetical protein
VRLGGAARSGADGHEHVLVAADHDAHAGRALEASGQTARERERDIFLAQTARTDGAQVGAAVAGIERDHERSDGSRLGSRGLSRRGPTPYGNERRHEHGRHQGGNHERGAHDEADRNTGR